MASGDATAQVHEGGWSPRARRRRQRRGLSPAQLRAVGRTVIVAILWTVLTIVVFTALPRYQLPGEPFLDNTDFRNGFRGWETRGIITLDEVEVGRATLQNRNPDEAVYLRRTITLPQGQTSLLLAADVATRQVRRGREPWQAARIYLVQEEVAGQGLWHQPNRLVELVGTTGRQHVQEIFEIPATIDRVVLGIELPYATGQFEVANLRLAVVDELPVFRFAATLLVAGWALLASWVFWRTLRSLRRPKVRTLVVLCVGSLVLGVFMPSTVRQQLIDALAAGLGLDVTNPDAVGHAIVFGLLAMLVRSGRKYDPLLLHLACWVLVAAATEVLQLLVVDRDPEALDWLMDVVGVGIGLVLAEAGLWLERVLDPPRKARPERPG